MSTPAHLGAAQSGAEGTPSHPDLSAPQVLILGAGIGGLSLALALHARGVRVQLLEAVSQILPLGVGINVMPHASAVLADLQVLPALQACAITTRQAAFYTAHGELIYAEAAGQFGGAAHPQLSIHRGDLQMVLLAVVQQRLGAGAVRTGVRIRSVGADAQGAWAEAADGQRYQAALIVASDGIHSAVRKALAPDEGAARYSGVNMWRGTTVAPPFLDGATMVRAGWLSVGKMVIYPIRNLPDGQQLINWVAELECPQPAVHDWGQRGRLDDFLPHFDAWRFDWLDVPALIRGADAVWEYPMVDRDPLPTWQHPDWHGRITLLGDAAHPMVPRGSNGAGQAIRDAAALAAAVADHGTTPAALQAYEAQRRPITARVVLTNRSTPPDAIIERVHQRTGGAPLHTAGGLQAVMPADEARSIADHYRAITAG